MVIDDIKELERLLNFADSKPRRKLRTPYVIANAEEVIELFQLRSKIGRSLTNEEQSASHVLDQLQRADARLGKMLPKLYHAIQPSLLDYCRETFRAGDDEWWWQGVVRQKLSRTMNAASLFLVAGTVALTIDVFERFRSDTLGPWGLVAIAVPGGLAAMGASTFTSIGRPHVLRFARRLRRGAALSKLLIVMVVLGLAIGVRQLLLPRVATHYAVECVDAYNSGKYYQAIDNGEQALKLDPDLPDVHAAYAQSLAAIKNWDKSMEQFSRAAEMYPSTLDCWRLRNLQAFLLCISKQNFAEAVRIEDAVIQDATSGKLKIGPAPEDSVRVDRLFYAMYGIRAKAVLGLDSLQSDAMEEEAIKYATIALFYRDGKEAHAILAAVYAAKAARAESTGDARTAAAMTQSYEEEIQLMKTKPAEIDLDLSFSNPQDQNEADTRS